MKPLEEALRTSLLKLDTYFDSCKINGVPITDTYALWLNYNPSVYLTSFFTNKPVNTQQYSGTTGQRKALSLKKTLEKGKSTFFNTESLISYLIEHIGTRGRLYNCMWPVIREIAGFTHDLITSFSIKYAVTYMVTEEEARQEVTNIINNAIRGFYCREILICFKEEIKNGLVKFNEELKNDITFDQKGIGILEDYGQLLCTSLEALDKKYRKQNNM